MYYIQQWPDHSATLISCEGQRLFTFKTVESALLACRERYDLKAIQVIYESNSQRPAQGWMQ